MKTEQPQPGRSAMNGSHHPSSTTLSDKAFYLIALALLIGRSAEPGSLQQLRVSGPQNAASLQASGYQ